MLPGHSIVPGDLGVKLVSRGPLQQARKGLQRNLRIFPPLAVCLRRPVGATELQLVEIGLKAEQKYKMWQCALSS